MTLAAVNECSTALVRRIATGALSLVLSIWAVGASAGDCRLETRIAGEGAQHVVLLGGLSASSDEWMQTQAALADTYTVHVVSVPGLGGVAINGGACIRDIDGLASALAHYIRTNVRVKPVMVGHSAGGLAALRLAYLQPELLSGLVVVDALPFMAENFGAKQVDDALRQKADEDSSQITTEHLGEFTDRIRKQLASAIGDKVAADRIGNAAMKSDRATYAGLYRSTMTSDFREELPPKELPTFVIYADQAPNGAPPGFMRGRYARQYPSLDPNHLLEVTQSRHYVMLDQPGAFQAHLLHSIKSSFDERAANGPSA